MSDPIGLYIHVPFCVSKCPYCDFYSLQGQSPEVMDAYTNAVIDALALWYQKLGGVSADTLYIGGGTPTLLGGKRLKRILDKATKLFKLKNAEITMEANPGDLLDEVFSAFASAGGNRVSIGMQTCDDAQLRFLRRRHRPQDVENAVAAAHACGINNISLDIMLGLRGQSVKSVVFDISRAFEIGASHVSAYILKIEEGTLFYQNRDTLFLPDSDECAELYLAACQTADMLGYRQYEISNFAMPGYECRHNIKYWNLDPYLGIGPAAHSYINNTRFYYEQDINLFLKGVMPVHEQDKPQKGNHNIHEHENEYIMLRLRLDEGIKYNEFKAKFGRDIPQSVIDRAKELPSHLISVDNDGIRLTRLGFLLSNTLICKLLYD
ncbi:MAG: radical SAM family heme chaperone HemW [Oscillospiraceae bacterium]|jgi:oxygen-independent coproporphyrinogen-3 oxidase|nr:radical SAM family heme chaperone HemW [Oscillospiraceae bacterium]